MPNNQITFGINFTSDTTELKNIQQNLLAIKNISAETGQKLISSGQFKGTAEELERIKNMAGQVSDALGKTFNSALGTANSAKFNQELKSMGINMSQVQTGFSSLGSAGQFVFSQLRGGMAGVNYQLKAAHPLINKIAEGFGKTFTWGIYSRAMNALVGSIQNAYSYVQKLDKSLNNIRIVTGKSSEEMAKFAIQANKAAKSLGANTTDYTNASLIYYQQGLSDAEVRARTEVTVKVANITKQSADEVSEQLTAVWNGYRVSAEEAELYIDKLSAIAASTASDLEELSTAMSKVASAAAAMGVDIDQLTAQISTIVSVTRQDAASVGTALKTIYARMGDLTVAGDAVDEFGVSLGDVSGQLAIMGVNVLDQQGNMRDLGTVIEEVAAKWGTWTEAQQQAAAVALAGKRQYNNLIALFNNWDMYQSALETSQTSEGTLQKQQDIYMESLEAHLEKLSAAGEKLYNSLFDSDSFKEILDILSFLVERVGDFVDAIGGGAGALQFLGSILVSVFSAKIGQSIGTFTNNLRIGKKNAEEYKNELYLLNQAKDAFDKGEGSALNAAYHQEVFDDTKRRVTFEAAARKGILSQEDAAKLILKEQNVEQAKRNIFSAQFTVGQEGNKEQQEALANAFELAKQGKLTKADLDKIGDYNIDFAGRREKIESAAIALSAQKTTGFEQFSYDGGNEEYQNTKQQAFKPNWASARKELKQQATDLLELGNISDETRKKITSALDGIGERGPVAEEKVKALTDAMSEGFKEAGVSSDNLKESLVNVNKEEGELTEQQKMLQQQIGTQMVMQLASAFTLLAQTISSVARVLSDDTLTAADKTKQIFTALIGLLPALIPIILSINATIKQTGVTLWGALAPILPIILAIAAAIAVVVGIVYVITSAIEAQHKAEKAAKAASKAYDEQKQILDDLKKSYNDLKQAIEDYHDAQKAIDSLVEGTQEWRDAIAEANQQVIELINTYPELAKYVSTNQSGRLTISQEGFDALVKLQEDQISQAQARAAEAKIVSNKANEAADYEKARNKAGQEVMRDSKGNIFYDANGSALTEYALKENEYNDIIKFIQDNPTVTNKEIENALKNIGVTENLEELAKNLRENAKTVTENTIANKVLGREIAASKLKDNAEYQNFEYQVVAEGIAQQKAEADYQNQYDVLVAQINKNTGYWGKDSSKFNAGVADEYVKLMESRGETGYTAKDGKVFKDGKELGIDTESMLRLLAEDNAYNAAVETVIADTQAQVDNVNKVLSAGAKNNSKIINKILQSSLDISIDISDMTEDELTEIQKGLENISTADLSEEDSEKIKEGMQGVISAYENEKTKILRNQPSFVNDLLFGTDGAFSGLTLGMKKQISAALQSAFSFSGTEGAEATAAFLQQYSGDELKRVSEIFTEIDWSSRDAYNQFISSMRAANIEIKNQTGVYSNLVETFNASRSVVKDLTTDFEKFKEQIIEIQGILDDLHPGDFIDQEDLDKLLAYNAALEKYFILTTKGYQFIGNQDQVKKTVNEVVTEVVDAVTEFGELNNQVGAFVETGTKVDSQSLVSPDLAALQELLKNPNKYNEILKQTGFSTEQLQADLNTRQNLAKYTGASKVITQEQKDAVTTVLHNLDALGVTDPAARQELINTVKKYSPQVNGTDLSDIDFENIDQYFTREELLKDLGLTDSGQSIEDLLNERNARVDAANDNIAQVNNAVDELVKQYKNKEIDLAKNPEAIQFIISSLGSLDDFDTFSDDLARLRDENILTEEQYASFLNELKKEEQGFILTEADALGLSTDAWAAWVSNTGASIEKQRELLQKFQASAALDIIKPSEKFARNIDILNNSIEAAEKQAESATSADAFIKSLQKQKDLNKEIIEQQKKKNEALDREVKTREEAFEASKQEHQYTLRNLNGDLYSQLYDANGELNYDVAYQMLQIAKDTKNKTAETAIQELIDKQNVLDDAQDEYFDGINELYDKTKEIYNNTINQISDIFDRQLETYQNLQRLINHDLNLVTLIYGEQAYGEMSKYYQKNTELLRKQLNVLDNEVERTYKNLQQFGADTTSAEYRQANQLYLDALEERADYFEQWLQSIKDNYINTVSDELKNFFDKTFGEGGQDLFSFRWDTETEQAERYLDIVNQTYELRKLEGKYQDSIKSFEGNVKAQQKLNDLLKEQQKYLQEKDRLSQYDLERANALYDLEVKRLQLEEARNNATKMQLVRDSEGNYRYQFVADQDNIAERQQEYQDSQANLWNIQKDRTEELINEYLQLQDKMKQDLAEVTNKPLEEQEKYRQEVLDRYFGKNGLFASLGHDFDSVYDDLKSSLPDIAEAMGLSVDDLWAVLSTFTELAGTLGDKDYEALKKQLEGTASTYEKEFGEAKEEGEGYLQDVTDTDIAAADTQVGYLNEAIIELVKSLTGPNGLISQFEELNKSLNEIINRQVTPISPNNTNPNKFNQPGQGGLLQANAGSNDLDYSDMGDKLDGKIRDLGHYSLASMASAQGTMQGLLAAASQSVFNNVQSLYIGNMEVTTTEAGLNGFADVGNQAYQNSGISSVTKNNVTPA